MRFTLPILLATGVLLVAGATSAEAAPARFPTQPAPTGVAAGGTGTSVTLSWTPATSPGSAKVLAYTTLLTPGSGQPSFGLKVVRATVHSVTYSRLTAGKTYSLSVSATGRYGLSKPVTVKYRAQDPAPVPAPQTLFAVDSTGTLVKTPAAGGATTPVQAGAVAYAVNPAGDAFVLTSNSVVKVTAAGVSTTVLGGVTGATDLRIDAKNDVFLLEGSTIVELPFGATATKSIVTSTARIDGWGVNTAGTVSVLEGNSLAETLTVVTAPVTGAPSTRSVAGNGYGTAFGGQFDNKGTVYYSDGSSGASGAQTAKRVAAGASTFTTIGGGNFVQGVGLSDNDYLVQSASWCPVPSLNSGSCVPDLTVATIQVTSDTGVTSTVPVTGLTVGRGKDADGAAQAVTSDTAGDIYVTEAAGVFEYAPSGGNPKMILTGSYSDVTLNR